MSVLESWLKFNGAASLYQLVLTGQSDSQGTHNTCLWGSDSSWWPYSCGRALSCIPPHALKYASAHALPACGERRASVRRAGVLGQGLVSSRALWDCISERRVVLQSAMLCCGFCSLHGGGRFGEARSISRRIHSSSLMPLSAVIWQPLVALPAESLGKSCHLKRPVSPAPCPGAF